MLLNFFVVYMLSANVISFCDSSISSSVWYRMNVITTKQKAWQNKYYSNRRITPKIAASLYVCSIYVERMCILASTIDNRSILSRYAQQNQSQTTKTKYFEFFEKYLSHADTYVENQWNEFPWCQDHHSIIKCHDFVPIVSWFKSTFDRTVMIYVNVTNSHVDSLSFNIKNNYFTFVCECVCLYFSYLPPPSRSFVSSYSSFIGLLAPFWNCYYCYYYYYYYYFFRIPVAVPAPAAGSVKSWSPSVLIVMTLPLKEPPPPYSIIPADNLPAVSTATSDLIPSCYSSACSSSNSSSLSKKFFG